MASPSRTCHVRPFPRSGALRSVAVFAVLGALLAGCFTGQRPDFDSRPSQTMTGRLEIDAVLERLDAVPFAQFTADYDVLTKLGDIRSTAVVVQAANSRRSITVNSVRYLFDGSTIATCNLDAGTCEAQINDARTSDLQLTHDFYGRAFATRLRVDAERRIGEPVGFEITQGGQPALCVDIPVTGGTKRYCALESGPLALYDGNDLDIALNGYSTTPEESAFATS